MDQFAAAAQSLEDDIAYFFPDDGITVEPIETSAGNEYWVRAVPPELYSEVELIIDEPRRGASVLHDQPSEEFAGTVDLQVSFRNRPFGELIEKEEW